MASERRHRWRRDRASAAAGCVDDSSAPVLANVEVAKHHDPRLTTGYREVRTSGRGRNSESFDPRSTLVRPDLRVLVGPKRPRFEKKVRHDDVIIIPEFFCAEDDFSVYHSLLAEIRDLQDQKIPNSDWSSWHEGCHLITKNPERAPLFQNVVDQMCTYFDVDPAGDLSTRLNWYKDSSDWKPFHHDSAAFNEHRAQRQNITIGASFGAERELAFHHARHGTLAYFPQPNGSMFSFGRDVNIRWKHAINALKQDTNHGNENGCETRSSGRISIILWGRSRYAIDEEGSPSLLTEEMRGNAGYVGDQTCRDFLRGFCHQGSACKLRHV